MENMLEVSSKILDFYQSLTHNATLGRYARKSLFYEMSQFYPRVTGGQLSGNSTFPTGFKQNTFYKKQTF